MTWFDTAQRRCTSFALIALWAGCAAQPTPPTTLNPDDTTSKRPLNLLYVVHVHAYDDGKIPTETEYNQLIVPVRRLADALEAHGAKGTFEVVSRIADAALKYEGVKNTLVDLEERGHEIGGHAHAPRLILDAYEALKRAGVKNVDTMGAAAARLDPTNANMRLAADAGYSFFTHNASPTDTFGGSTCADFGLGQNRMYNDTQNIMHPWRPEAARFCAHDNNGDIVYIDTAIPDWWQRDNDRRDHTVTDEAYEKAKPWLLAALRHTDPSRTNVWGLVSHQIGEYTRTYEPPSEISDEAFSALDRYLTFVDGFIASGEARYATVRDVGNEFNASNESCSEPNGICDASQN